MMKKRDKENLYYCQVRDVPCINWCFNARSTREN